MKTFNRYMQEKVDGNKLLSDIKGLSQYSRNDKLFKKQFIEYMANSDDISINKSDIEAVIFKVRGVKSKISSTILSLESLIIPILQELHKQGYFKQLLEDKYMTKEEWAKVQGMTHSELKKYNKLKRFLRDLYRNTDQQKKENKEK